MPTFNVGSSGDSGPNITVIEEGDGISITPVSSNDPLSVTMVESPTGVSVEATQSSEEVTNTIAPTGVQGPTGPQGEQGIPGEQSFYVSPTAPVGVTRDYLWVETGLGPTGSDWTLWFEDGGV